MKRLPTEESESVSTGGVELQSTQVQAKPNLISLAECLPLSGLWSEYATHALLVRRGI